MKRREARDLAFQLIFESTYNTFESANALYESEKESREFEEDMYVLSVLCDFFEHKDEIDALISSFASGWKFDRISRTSLSIMRLSCVEMLYHPDIPFNISINEAVELAKKYDTDQAPAFINGILNKIATEKGLKNQ